MIDAILSSLSAAELHALDAGCAIVRQAAEVVAPEGEPRRPGLAGRPDEALRRLRSPLVDLIQELLTAARSSAGLSQARRAPAGGEEAAALTHFGVALTDAGRLYDRAVAVSWDTELARWSRRHDEVVAHLIADLGTVGRTAALAELGLETAETVTDAVWARVPLRFASASEQIAASIRRGTLTTEGLIDLIAGVRTVGAAALYLRRMFDAVTPALERLAEQVTWTAYAEGYRLAAIDGTHARLRAADVLPGAGAVLTTASLPAEVLVMLPRYRWSGPQDAQTCGPCGARQREIVYALSEDAMPSCQEVCAHGDACRHHWALV